MYSFYSSAQPRTHTPHPPRPPHTHTALVPSSPARRSSQRHARRRPAPSPLYLLVGRRLPHAVGPQVGARRVVGDALPLDRRRQLGVLSLRSGRSESPQRCAARGAWKYLAVSGSSGSSSAAATAARPFCNAAVSSACSAAGGGAPLAASPAEARKKAACAPCDAASSSATRRSSSRLWRSSTTRVSLQGARGRSARARPGWPQAPRRRA